MNAAFRLACLFALPIALAACGQEKPEEKARAGGEILPGSTSDAMLPLDSLRSQPPAAPPSEGVAGKRDAAAAVSGEPEGTASDAAGAAASEAAPAASASPSLPTE